MNTEEYAETLHSGKMFDIFRSFSSGRMNVCLLLTLVMLVTLTMAMSPRKLQRHVYDDDRPIYNVTLNS